MDGRVILYLDQFIVHLCSADADTDNLTAVYVVTLVFVLYFYNVLVIRVPNPLRCPVLWSPLTGQR